MEAVTWTQTLKSIVTIHSRETELTYEAFYVIDASRLDFINMLKGSDSKNELWEIFGSASGKGFSVFVPKKERVKALFDCLKSAAFS